MIENFGACLGFTLDPMQDGQPLHVTPGDAGGATAWGITRATWSKWIQRPATMEDMAALTKDDAGLVYKAWYWHTVAGDSLPVGIDLMIFDHGVTCGGHESAIEFQRMIGFTGSDQDGQIGKITLAAAADYKPADLIAALSLAQAVHYRSLADFSKFGHGWLARVDRRHARAIEMVTHPTTATASV